MFLEEASVMSDVSGYREKLCPVCGSRRYKVLYPDTLGKEIPEFGYDFGPKHNKTYRIVQCLDCTHGYASSAPAKLWENYEDVVDPSYLANAKERLITAAKALKRIRKYQNGGRLLDVGCSTGDFLQAAREFYDVEGLELSGWASKIARDKGLKIHSCLPDNLKADRQYDVVTLWGVIEHFGDPKYEVESICKLIKQGGLVCLWTGDVDSFPSRLLGKKWWWIQGQHIQFFTRKSLAKLMSDNGFGGVYFGMYPYVMSMQAIAKSLERYKALGIVRNILRHPSIKDISVEISLPGEMFAIFRKI
ncbi:MAG: class I SAM-dependent methyltransferase [Candidatus Omnitrophica bacterium]|nr:class I SAM-dependent methyltransferase [Candidatus Omnitrophota bacterium]